MNSMTEKRFQALKRRLDALHYSQPISKLFVYLAIESSALVDRLLSDMIKTTEGFQSIKKQNEDLRAAFLKEKQLVILLNI